MNISDFRFYINYSVQILLTLGSEKTKNLNKINSLYISPPASFDLPPPAACAAPLPPTTRACTLRRAPLWQHPRKTAREGHEEVLIGFYTC